jgi:hypothetical protein
MSLLCAAPQATSELQHFLLCLSLVLLHFLRKFLIVLTKEIGHKEPYYDIKILICSFTWAGLAAFHKASTI